MVTSNGGISWQGGPGAQGSTPITLNGVSYPDSGTVTVVGYDGPPGSGRGLILRNGTPQSSGTNNPLYGVSFVDVNTGWAVGDLGTILHTTDGGATWRRQSTSTLSSLVGVSFVDANTGNVVGLEGTILRTTTGGE
jgi:hypothetical protein